MKHIAYLILLLAIACGTKKNKNIGTIERLDPALDTILSLDATIEILADGFEWSEGPLWLPTEHMLLFSDVPKNTVYKWTEEKGIEVYLKPSGFTTSASKKGDGSNGLLLDDEGNLILCQHGDRRLAMMDAYVNKPDTQFITIADQYKGKKFNSPNDAIFYDYNFYFTDPAYGLEKQMNDPAKEIPFQGVYKVSLMGEVTLLVDSLTRPNGLAFYPNQKSLIVANSDPEKARWYRFDFNEQDTIGAAAIFYDATKEAKTEKGLPDGLKIDHQGTIFATGPGGIWIFNATGKLLGKIKIPVATSNCALTDDDKTLFITADMYILRVALRP